MLGCKTQWLEGKSIEWRAAEVLKRCVGVELNPVATASEEYRKAESKSAKAKAEAQDRLEDLQKLSGTAGDTGTAAAAEPDVAKATKDRRSVLIIDTGTGEMKLILAYQEEGKASFNEIAIHKGSNLEGTKLLKDGDRSF